ncbi:hypothetical protein L3V82_08070 [Thiotrichales bacterium 19S3-7]|nr:hypothetical protein [Thiotrichales bacterium 19S3-7]MCF6802116.1 hypothetical protein [Thiotrichales bacterium 19S3-11]
MVNNQLTELMNTKSNENSNMLHKVMCQLIHSKASLEERKNLLLAKDHTLMPGLMSALLNNKSQVVNTYVETILESGLVFEDIKELLLIDDKFKNTAHHLLYQALINDCPQLVYFYVSEILELDCDSKTKKSQLTLNQPFGTPGLYTAMANGSYESVKTYIRLIINSELAKADKIDLILAKNFDGMNAISSAIRSNQYETVALYFKQLGDFHITELEILSKLYSIYNQIGKVLMINDTDKALYLEGVPIKYQGDDFIASAEIQCLLEKLTDELGYFNLQGSNSDLILIHQQIDRELGINRIIQLYNQVN